MANIDASKFFSLIINESRILNEELPLDACKDNLLLNEGINLCKKHGINPIYDLLINHCKTDPEFIKYDIFGEDIMDVIIEEFLGIPFCEYYNSDEFQNYINQHQD